MIVVEIIASGASLLLRSTCPLSIYIVSSYVGFGPAEAPALRANVSRLIESSKVTAVQSTTS